MEKICVHNFLNKCETGSLPPGIMDFLRGTIALFHYSKKYGYKLYINRSIHPLFKYFENCEYYIDTYNSDATFELLSQASPTFVDHILERLFQSGFNFSVLTNCLVESKISLTDECKEFLKKILTPTKTITDKLDSVYKILNIKEKNYYAVHIRFGDDFLHEHTKINENIINVIDDTINKNIPTDKPIVLVADSKSMANELVKTNSKMIYWDNKKIHTGYLVNYDEKALTDTLIDILILSKSCKIFTFNVNTKFFTTFSPLIAKIYDIENLLFRFI